MDTEGVVGDSAVTGELTAEKVANDKVFIDRSLEKQHIYAVKSELSGK